MSGRDLVVLVADKDMQHTLMGLFKRTEALGVREIECNIYVEQKHDPACARNGVSFLSRFSDLYDHALLLFDHEGSGKEDIKPEQLQQSLNKDFDQSGWRGRARAIVIDPELEAWVWSPSPWVAKVIKWGDQQSSFHDWMVHKRFLRQGESKPRRPKEAFHEALRKSQTPRSAALYEKLAEKVSSRNCKDRAFLDLRSTLQEWFPR